VPGALRSAWRAPTGPGHRDYSLGLRAMVNLPRDTSPIGALEKTPVDNESLVLWLKGDHGVIEEDGRVSRWKDKLGRGNHAFQPVPERRPTAKTDGKRSWMDFDGQDDYLEILHSKTLDIRNEMTVAAWARISSTPQTAANVLLAKYHMNKGKSWIVMLNQASRRISLTASSDGQSTELIESKAALPSDSWHHFAFVFKKNSSSVYVNGDLDTARQTRLEALRSIPAIPLRIGWTHASDGKPFLKGRMDDIRIYNRAMTAKEISQLVIQAGPAPE
jgi:hypothetical protein